MKTKKLFRVTVLACALGAWGCGDDKETEQTFDVSSRTLQVEVDERKVIEATGNFEGNATYVSEDTNIATVNEFGGVEGITEGTTKIIVSVGTGEKKKTVEVAVTVVAGTLPTPKGAWLFDDADDLFQARIGQALKPGQGGKDAADQAVDLLVPTTALSHFTAVAGRKTGDGAIRVDRGYFLEATHGIAANGGGTMVNEYTVSWVIKFSDAAKWTGLLQTDPANSNDADCFVVDLGMGQSWSGRTDDKPIVNGQWHTLVFSMKCGEDGHGTKNIYYCDGVPLPVGYSKGENTLQNIDDNRSLDLATVLFLADNDGEDPENTDGVANTVEVSDIRIWDRALTDDDVQKLHVKLNK
ncbi:hypothetical protein AGMMS4957_09930 [Bacteroidia bacterium]|nr:hypothetical protein AGMMS4957_09930 [Bacteroidia bacterium]